VIVDRVIAMLDGVLPSRLAGEIRRSILDGSFREAKAAFLAAYQPSAPEVARDQRARWLVAHGRA
jgi:hypothetical protein